MILALVALLSQPGQGLRTAAPSAAAPGDAAVAPRYAESLNLCLQADIALPASAETLRRHELACRAGRREALRADIADLVASGRCPAALALAQGADGPGFGADIEVETRARCKAAAKRARRAAPGS